MAKDPKVASDEEEIIRRRDDVAYLPSDEPVTAETRRALADSRLRALAFSLSTDQSKRDGAHEIDDTELLRYLLDSLAPDRRVELEVILRGDARAFGRLMTLRSAFYSRIDTRDRNRADDPKNPPPYRRPVGRTRRRGSAPIQR